MCGQYYCDSSTFHNATITGKCDMKPGCNIPVYLYYQGKIILTQFNWGYDVSSLDHKIINARCETLEDKKIFKEDFKKRRCIIPAKGFYQKDSAQHQMSFESSDTIYMAGIYHHNQVVIITTQANSIMKPIHDRMPLMLKKKDIHYWLKDEKQAQELLKSKNEDLVIKTGYLQQSLF